MRTQYVKGHALLVAALGSVAFSIAALACRPAARADDRAPASSGGAPGPGSAGPAGKLDENEESLARRYQQFEQMLLHMAEYLKKTEPDRAELLMRAIGKSKEERVSQQMEQITALLKKSQFGDAIGGQEHLVADLRTLLDLLQSEDRRHQLDEEKQRYELLQKEVGKLTAREKDLRRATEGARNLGPLAERQRDIGEEARRLVEKIDKQDAERNVGDRKPSDRASKNQQQKGNSGKQSPGEKNLDRDGKPPNSRNNPDSDKDRNKNDGPADKDKSPAERDKSNGAKSQKSSDAKKSPDKKSPDKKSPDKKSQNGKRPDGKPEEKKSPDGKSQRDRTDKESQNKDASKNRESKDGKSQRQQGERPNQSPPREQGDQPPQDSPPQDADAQQQQEEERNPRKTPGREEIEKARRAMQQAEEELKKLHGDEARERQEEAIRNLEKAKQRLEKILRQLREEEQEITLASLEARFARMLLMELQIQVDTITLAKTKKGDWSARHFGRARELSITQESIADDAGKALALLKEEGSSVAFPKGVEQVRDDMIQIARWLSNNDVGDLTQQIEKDVIESLEEMVASLQAEIENRKKPENQRQRRRQQGQSGEQEKQLVEKLAELKMLRSLQLRVNRRTKEIGRRIKGEQASSDELSRMLQKLAQQQAEIQEATYILSSGRAQ